VDLMDGELLGEDVDPRWQCVDLQRYRSDLHGEDVDLGRVGADLGRRDGGCIFGDGGEWTRRRDLQMQRRGDLEWSGDAGGGGRRQGKNVPALLPANDTLAAGVVDDRLPSVGRHEGVNCNGGEGGPARRKGRT
jgi:hypothetical protein